MRRRLAPIAQHHYGLLLVSAIVVSFLCFQFLVIFTALNLDGACMYSFWAPSLHPEFSPFWLFLAIVALITVVVCAWAFNSVANSSRKKSVTIILCFVMLSFLGFWAWRLWALWQLFLLESGIQESEYWLSVYQSSIKPQSQCQPRF